MDIMRAHPHHPNLCIGNAGEQVVARLHLSGGRELGTNILFVNGVAAPSEFFLAVAAFGVCEEFVACVAGDGRRFVVAELMPGSLVDGIQRRRPVVATQHLPATPFELHRADPVVEISQPASNPSNGVDDPVVGVVASVIEFRLDL
jgi:hypothetical protein